MPIDEYLKSLEKLLDALPSVLSINSQIENRGNIALYIKLEIVFNDMSELHANEYFITIPEFTKIAYSYHYQDKEKALIFRYDNAEHHPEIQTFPYHKHLEDSVLSSKAMVLTEVIEEVLRLLLREKS